MRGSRIGRRTAGFGAVGLAAIGLAGCASGPAPLDAADRSADLAALAGPWAARDLDRSGQGRRSGIGAPAGGIGAPAGDGAGAGDPGAGRGWPVAADCPATLRALAEAAARDALPREPAGAPLALLEPPGAAGAATLLVDVALPRLAAVGPDAPPCLLELAVEPAPAERRVVGRETVWSERAAATERRVNPEHEAARRELARLAERLEREDRAQAKDISRLTMTGNPLVDAAGLLGGLVLGGIGSLARDRELAEAEARVAAIPRLIEETRFEPYELAVEATDLVRRARVRAALVERAGGRRTVELPVERADRLLVAPHLHPRDRSRLARDGRLVAPADLEALAASPPPVPVSALLGPLAAALAGPDPATPPAASAATGAPLAGPTGAGLAASPIGTGAPPGGRGAGRPADLAAMAPMPVPGPAAARTGADGVADPGGPANSGFAARTTASSGRSAGAAGPASARADQPAPPTPGPSVRRSGTAWPTGAALPPAAPPALDISELAGLLERTGTALARPAASGEAAMVGAPGGPGGAGAASGWAAAVPRADGARQSEVWAAGPGGSADPGAATVPADGRWRVGRALGAQPAAGPAVGPAEPGLPRAALVTVEGQGGRAHGFYLGRGSILTLGRVLGGSSLARVTTADGFETWGVVAHAPPGELVLLHVERAGRALPLAAAGSPLPASPLPAAGLPLLAGGMVVGVSLDPLAGRAADAAELARLLAGLKGR